jgi:hypothetical protein
MHVRHLRNLLPVITEESLGRAARRLNISQPALTRGIQRLWHSMNDRKCVRQEAARTNNGSQSEEAPCVRNIFGRSLSCLAPALR